MPKINFVYTDIYLNICNQGTLAIGKLFEHDFSSRKILQNFFCWRQRNLGISVL